MSEALDRMDHLGYERGGSGADLANHGPMGAEALAAMGFTDEVAGWAERYKAAVPHHDPPQPRLAIDRADESSWRPALGQFARAGDWERLFRLELADQPWRAVLITWWPRLLPGMLSRLTHGLIRTAHAVRDLASEEEPGEQQLRELARGLAYWAARYTALPGHASLGGPDTVAQVVARLPRTPADPAGGARLSPQRLRRLPAEPGYNDALTGLKPGRADWLLSEMTSVFAGVYIVHPELPPVPLVHGVTAPAAVRLVLPHLPSSLHAPSVAAMWHVHVALLLAFTDHGEAPGSTGDDIDPALDDAELMSRALEHADEHAIKFTEACLRENALRPDPRYPAAALTAMRRIPALPA
jgi:hypothetical protein